VVQLAGLRHEAHSVAADCGSTFPAWNDSGRAYSPCLFGPNLKPTTGRPTRLLLEQLRGPSLGHAHSNRTRSMALPCDRSPVTLPPSRSPNAEQQDSNGLTAWMLHRVSEHATSLSASSASQVESVDLVRQPVLTGGSCTKMREAPEHRAPKWNLQAVVRRRISFRRIANARPMRAS